MAFVADQEEEQQQAGQPPQAGPVLGAPAAAPAQGGGQAAPGATTGKGKPSRSGSFTNLNNYLQANQGNDAQMGTAVRGTVDNQAGAAKQALGGMQKEATDQAEKNTVRQNAQVQSTIASSPEAFDGNTGLTDQFKQQYNASYNGPNRAEDVGSYGDTQQSFAKVGNFVNSAKGGYQGAQNLVGQTYRDQGYTQGQRSLDSFILGGGAQGQQALKGIGDSYGNFGGNFTAAEQGINSNLEAAKATTDATRTATRDAVKAKDTEFGTYFDGLQTQAGTKTAEQKALYDKAASGDSTAIQQLTGLDAATVQSLASQGYDFKKLIQSGSAYGIGDLADQGKVQGYNSLMKLIGQAPTRDFTPAGGKDVSFDATQAEAARQLPGASNAVQSAIAGAQTGQFDRFLNPTVSTNNNAIDADLRALGISRDDYKWMQENGIDPRKFVEERQLTAGGVAGDSLTSYQALANTLGIQPGVVADKGLGVSRSANQEALKSLRSAHALDSALASKRNAAQQKRNAEVAAQRQALRDQLMGNKAFVESGADVNATIDQYLKRGRDYTNYDVSDEGQRSKWSGLMSALGINKALNPAADEAAYSFDQAGWDKAFKTPNAYKGGAPTDTPSRNQTPLVTPPRTPIPTPTSASTSAPSTLDQLGALGQGIIDLDPTVQTNKALAENDPTIQGNKEIKKILNSDKNTKDDIKDISWSNIRKMVK